MHNLRLAMGLLAGSTLLTTGAYGQGPRSAPITPAQAVAKVNRHGEIVAQRAGAAQHQFAANLATNLKENAAALLTKSTDLRLRTRGGVTRITNEAGLTVTLAGRANLDPEMRVSRTSGPLSDRFTERTRVRATSELSGVSTNSDVTVNHRTGHRSANMEHEEAVGSVGTVLRTEKRVSTGRPVAVRKTLVLGDHEDVGQARRVEESEIRALSVR